MMFQRITALFLCCLLLLLPVLATEAPIPLESIDESAVPHVEYVAAAAVYNLENETVIFSHHADDVLPTASFTKMMTAICAYELLQDRLDETLTVEYSMIKDATGNQVGYYVGETVSVRDMFGGLLLRGANDSALLLAHVAKGGTADFVAYMNERAAALGMKNTRYQNPTGMDAEGMVTTASDSILVARAFYEIEFLTALSGAVKYEMPATERSGVRIIYNRNALASRVIETGYFDSRILGINSGSTAAAGYYTAGAVKSEELTYIIVVLGGQAVEERNTAYTVASELATYALTQYGYTEVIKTTKIVCEMPVRLSTDGDYVTLVPASNLTLYLPTSVDPKEDLSYSYRLETEALDAPVTEGQVVGTYSVTRGDGEILGSVDLITKTSLSRSEFLVVLDAIERFTTSTFFITTIIVAVILLLLYFVLTTLFKHRRRSRLHSRIHRKR